MFDSASLRQISGGVRKEHGLGIAGARLDPQVFCSRCEAEHQQHVRAVLGYELRQFSIDSRIAGAEHVTDEVDIGKGRAAAPREAPYERFRRIERRAWKRAEARDQYGERPTVALPVRVRNRLHRR